MEYFDLTALNLPENTWAPFLRNHQPLIISAGQIIYLQDTPAISFYYLKKGRVRAYLSSPSGEERILHTYREGNLFGEASFFDEMDRLSSATAETRCEIITIDRPMVMQEMKENPELAMALLKYLARTVRLLSAQVDHMTFLSAEQRIAQLLLSLHADADGMIHVSQDDIASAVSVSRVTVNRTLRKFSDSGIVQTGYGSVRLMRSDILQNL